MKIDDLLEDWQNDKQQREWLDRVLAVADFTEHDYDAGTSQYCGTFALVLCRLIPGTVPVMCVPTDGYGEQLGSDWRHVAVDFHGALYDIYGMANNEKEMLSNFDAELALDVDVPTLIKYIGTDEKSYSRRWYRKWEEMVKAALMKVGGLAR